MALIVRDPWSGKPLRAIEVTKTPAQLKPLFYCDLKHALLHSTFRRIVLRNALGIKLDGRTFSSLLRELDPCVSAAFSSFRGVAGPRRRDPVQTRRGGVATAPSNAPRRRPRPDAPASSTDPPARPRGPCCTCPRGRAPNSASS